LRVRFESKRLAALYSEEAAAKRYPSEVVDAFFELMTAIDAAIDERDLYALKGLHFEKLKGGRKNDRSMRLNRSWRLIVRMERDDSGKLVVVVNLENHYGD
jgi:proteic killer suppression protein